MDWAAFLFVVIVLAIIFSISFARYKNDSQIQKSGDNSVNIQGSNNGIIINGISYSGKNVSIIGSKVVIDGVEQSPGVPGDIPIRILNDANITLTTDHSVNAGNITGNVSANNINCDDIRGNVNASGNVNCDDVYGFVNVGGNLNCDDVFGQ